MSATSIDFEKFRLRTFVERLIEMGECEVCEEAVSLAGLSSRIEATRPAKLFKRVGAERYEVVAGVSGSRRRLAAAFGVGERDLAHEYMRRLADPKPIVEVPSADAPVHQVVRTGEEVDLTRLPFHLQHELDGGPYLSSGLDFSVDPATGRSNVGLRRLMLRDRRTMRSHLYAPSDLQRIYRAGMERGQPLPVSFAVGCNPLDFLAATLRLPGDELRLVATVRGEAAPMVRGITNGVLAPADAEMIIEGYFDELGYREKEGPYGEFNGFYSGVLPDPVFHVTAITMRRDVLFQTVLHSGRHLSWTDSANLIGLNAEVQMWRVLKAANIEPAAVYSVPAANGGPHARIALRRGTRGQARLAISALFAIPRVKNVFVVDDEIDVFSDEQMEWAMSTRFRGDRDLVVTNGCTGFYNDPTTGADGTVAKTGFDLTAPYGKPDTLETRRPNAPRFGEETRRFKSVRDALASGPMYFGQLMGSLASDDGREIALALDSLRGEGVLERDSEGRYQLTAVAS
jgi:UbiD family decarboxylase